MSTIVLQLLLQSSICAPFFNQGFHNPIRQNGDNEQDREKDAKGPPGVVRHEAEYDFEVETIDLWLYFYPRHRAGMTGILNKRKQINGS